MAKKTKRFTLKNLAILASVVAATIVGVSTPRYINAKALVKQLQSMECRDVTSSIIPGSHLDRNFGTLYICPGNQFVPIPKILF
ncbi:MAG TPA: hypothetical protein VGD26_02105 [Chitinophagaceae bacterium]